MTRPLPLLTYGDVSVAVEPGETALEALLRAGVDAPHSCRAGACQTCLSRAVAGRPPPAAQEGLSAAQKAQGYFLPCVCLPDESMTVVAADAAPERQAAAVRGLDLLAPAVARLRLAAEGFACRPGQYLELIAPEGFSRHYSIADAAEAGRELELHVRLHEGGRMSRFITQQLAIGDLLEIAGPLGACYYEGVDPEQPLILAGAGTGLAPLWGVARDALARGHKAPIRLYHGAREKAGLYLHDALTALARDYANVAYFPHVLDPEAPERGDVAAAVLAQETDVTTPAFFLCGGENLVSRLKRALFLKGASLKQIRTDAFVPAK